MEKEFEEFPRILICNCHSTNHQIIIRYDGDENIAYLSIYLQSGSLFSRFKTAIRHIFGYKSIYGDWDEFIFNSNHSKGLSELSELLKR